MTPEIDAEVARIMAMTDEEVLAEATPEDLAWAARFKASIRTAIATRPTTCQHDWREVESMYSNEYRSEVRCALCREAGEQDHASGEVTWPCT